MSDDDKYEIPSGVQIKGTEEVLQEKLDNEDSAIEIKEDTYTSLMGYIVQQYQRNSDARESSGVNKILLESLQQYNGEYSAGDAAIIAAEGGSQVFMNLTSTKVRAAMAWIKDLLISGKVDAFSVEPTPEVTLKDEVVQAIKEKLEFEFEQAKEAGQGEIGLTLKLMQERKRDLMDAIIEEQNMEAEYAFKLYDTRIKDQMKEGDWDNALSSCIDDFCIFPTAIMKGPVVTNKAVITWEGGLPVSGTSRVFMNKRVSPFDVYPAPEASDVNTGNFLEHMRLSRKEVSDLHEVGEPYKADAIMRVLESNVSRGSWDIDTHIEQDKADAELKDNVYDSNANVFHALHFFGTAPVKTLKEWGLSEGIEDLHDEREVEIEALLIGNEVVKCILNDDPLHRRPYFTASFQRRPGSFWGSAPPWQMRDIQKICNATSRALMNNMGISSGPMMELNIERLADGQNVEELRARSVVQVTSDPTGGSGKAVQFFSAPSNAAELLAVYKEFEQRADDVTMIPRYAYGNERTGGAAQTATGLSMLLESASKGIKDAIRHLDEGIIIPRVELEFYYMMMDSEDLLFSGDSQVIARGSQTLTMRGSEQMRRSEFLQITSNPIDQEIMGPQGRAGILREMAEDLGFVTNPVPSRQEIKLMTARKQRLEAESKDSSDAMAIVQVQAQAQMQASENIQEIKRQELAQQREKDIADIQLRIQEIDGRREASTTAATARLQSTQMTNEAKAQDTNKNIALELKTNNDTL